MTRAPGLFISHTTRDERDHALARRLAAGLRERGVSVWIAPDSIPAGDQWRDEIVAGVMKGCSHFLVILSAASIVAPWVIEEVSLARKRHAEEQGFRILPLSVGKLAGHMHAEFLNAFQELAYHDDANAQIEAVAQAMGLRPTVPDAVSTIVAEKTRDFVGREYVFASIDQFMADNPNGYLTIEGDPGIGKSAILARFIQRSGCLAHFNVRAQGIDTARHFLESICGQIIARFGLPYATLPRSATEDGSWLSRLLEEAATRLTAGERLIIAVDALDEVSSSTERANVLFLPVTLPANVFFVLTRRQVSIALATSAPQETYDLMAHQDAGLEDARAFVRARFAASQRLRDWTTAHQIDGETFARELVGLSEGNFMYLRHVLPDLERGSYESLRVDQLPAGLEAYYFDHWRRMGMTAKPLPRVKIRIVYVLSEGRQPVSRRLISRVASDAILPVDEIAVQEVLDEWDEFIREQDLSTGRVFSIYHESFRDFLRRQDIVQAAGVSIREIHALIADNLWSDLFDERGP